MHLRDKMRSSTLTGEYDRLSRRGPVNNQRGELFSMTTISGVGNVCTPLTFGRACRPFILSCYILIDCIDYSVDVSKHLGLGCFYCAGVRRRPGLPGVVISALRAEYAKSQRVHIALFDVFPSVLEGAVWFRAVALLQERLAFWHSLRNHLVQETAVVSFHAHPLDPKGTDSLHTFRIVASAGWGQTISRTKQQMTSSAMQSSVRLNHVSAHTARAQRDAPSCNSLRNSGVAVQSLPLASWEVPFEAHLESHCVRLARNQTRGYPAPC